MRMYEKEGERKTPRSKRKMDFKETSCLRKKWFSLFAFKWK